MRIPDTIAVGLAAAFGLYWLFLNRTGRVALSLAATALTMLLAAEALRRFHGRPRTARRREGRKAYADAKRALRSLALRPKEDAIGTIRAVLSASFSLCDVSEQPDGMLCSEGERRVWVQALARHPEAGCVSAEDLALALRRQREEGADACVLCASCPAGKTPSDSDLRAVRVLDANALAQLWARSGVSIPTEKAGPHQSALRRLAAALVSPAPHGQRLRCAGYGALLLLGWALSHSPVLLLCACVQLTRGLRGLAATKKAPVRLYS